jgi:ATP-dependent helicase/nuclease subunit B
LKLQEREDNDVTRLDLGNVYHAVLEKIVGEVLQGRCDWANHTGKQRQKMVRDFARQIGDALRGEIFLSSARNQYLLSRIEQTLDKVMAQQSEIAKRGRFRPGGAESEFGEGKSLGAYTIRTPSGKTVELYGKIDRIDVLEDEAAVAVIDYKLTGSRLALDRVYHGISLQLLTYLLVLQANGEKLHRKKMTPAAAFYVKLLKNLERVQHPSDSDDARQTIKDKPRGLINRAYVRSIDTSLTSGRSEIVNVMIKQDGELGANSDAAEPAQFEALLRHVKRRIGELADFVIAGEISIRPYRLSDTSPCVFCSYASVCRFDNAVDKYHELESFKRDAIFQMLREAE